MANKSQAATADYPLPTPINPAAVAVEAFSVGEAQLASGDDCSDIHYQRSAAASLLVIAETQQAMLKELRQLRAMTAKR